MPTIQELKQGARKTWAEGDYDAVARFIPPVSAHLIRVAGVHAGQDVLDVACGTGVTAITAARAGAKVTGLDLTPELLAGAAHNATLAKVDVTWQEGDAEKLPFTDHAFDAVLSSFGHMFTPDPAAMASELLRVAKPGATIAFVTWPAHSPVGQMLKAVGAVLPPPAGSASPLAWGEPATIVERLGSSVTGVHFERGSVAWPMLSSGHMWELFSCSYGPFVAALARLADDPDKQAQLATAVQAIFDAHFRENAVHFDYLVTRAIKQ